MQGSPLLSSDLSLHNNTLHFSKTRPSTVRIHIVSTARSRLLGFTKRTASHNARLQLSFYFLFIYFFLPSFADFDRHQLLCLYVLKYKNILPLQRYSRKAFARFFGISYLHRDIVVPHTSTSNKVIFLSFNMKFK